MKMRMKLQFFGGRGSSGGKGGGGKSAGGGKAGEEKQEISQKEQMTMMEHYVGPEGFDMNAYARGEEFDEFYYSKEEIADFTNRFTAVMDAQSLPNEERVFRGSSFDTITQSTGYTAREVSANPDILVGKTITERGFMSTTSDRDMAKEYSQGKVMWDIQLPKGAKAVHQNSILRGLDGDEITIQRKAQVHVDSAYKKQGVVIIKGHYTGIKE